MLSLITQGTTGKLLNAAVELNAPLILGESFSFSECSVQPTAAWQSALESEC